MDEKSQGFTRGECDLPLSANFSEIQVHHYMLNLECDFYNKCFHGSTTIYFTQRGKRNLHDIYTNSSENENVSSCLTKRSDDGGKSFPAEPSPPERSKEGLSWDENEQNTEDSYLVEIGTNKRKSSDEGRAVTLVKQVKRSPSLFGGVDICSDLSPEIPDSGVNSKYFTLILDCHKVEIQSISEENVATSINREAFSSPNWTVDLNKISDNFLQYELGDQCIKIQVPFQNYDEEEKLRAIKISYKTMNDGQSLKWTKDQDNK